MIRDLPPRWRGTAAAAAVAAAVAGTATTTGSAATATPTREAPFFEGLGSYTMPVTTSSALAKRYFDQGVMLMYGFNHAEAERSFREAARLDPECALCWWGAAYVVGPNLNAPMEADAVPRAWGALQKARAAAAVQPAATPRERALIEALGARYAETPPEDRTALDGAYMVAMRAVAQRFPEDLDIQVLFAESLLDLRPWRWYSKTGEPEPGTEELVAILEGVLARNPDHPGAIHYYIHGTEGSRAPERAEAFADKLPALAPGLGHLVHMPSHTYFQIGRYHDGVRVNLEAERADNAYVTQCHAQGTYPLAYIPHNPHFGWACAAMAGESAQALRLAESTVQHTNASMLRAAGMGTLQHYSVIPLWAYTRFGRWSTLLTQPAPPADLKYPTGVWHYARGLAYARTERADLAQAELDKLRALAADDSLEQVTIWDINTASDLLRIAESALMGEIAATRRDWNAAIAALREGVRREDALNFNEPPDWHFPVRHMLGAVLLQAGQSAEAERIFREDLEIHPENGWALMGLANSLEGQGKSQDARQVMERFRKAFAHADVRILASRF